MKRLSVIVLCLAMAAAMAACSSSKKDREEETKLETFPTETAYADPTEAPAEAAAEKPAETAEPTEVVNPLTSVTADEMMQTTGIWLQVPENAQDIEYFVLDTGDFKTAQAQFTLDGNAYCLRAVSTQELETYDMSGEYYTWTQSGEAEVGYCTAKYGLCDEAASIYWLDIVPGINYTLGVEGKTDIDSLTEIAGQCFAPMQGDA